VAIEMPTWKRALIALVLASIAGLVWFPGLIYAIAAAVRCPPTDRVCDGPMMGAFSLAVLTTPVIVIAVGWVAFRRVGRPKSDTHAT
jgi:hypothetical protein